jgi:hypothetical protein
MLLPPFSWGAAVAYRVIAANRYRLPGGSPACAVSAQRVGDVRGGAHDPGAGLGRVELAERDHAD